MMINETASERDLGNLNQMAGECYENSKDIMRDVISLGFEIDNGDTDCLFVIKGERIYAGSWRFTSDGLQMYPWEDITDQN